jgi:hypothetical protein
MVHKTPEMDNYRDFGVSCARFSLLYFKRRVGSPLSNNGRVLHLDLMSEICPPLQHSSCLYSDLTTLVLSGILNGSNDQKCFSSFMGFRAFDQPELILCFPGCVAFDHSIFLNISSVCLSVTNFLYLCYLPSMTSIRCLLNIFQQSPPLALMATQALTCIRTRLSSRTLFSPFDINVKEETLFP